MFMFQMALPCLEATKNSGPDLSDQNNANKSLFVFSRCSIVESSATFISNLTNVLCTTAIKKTCFTFYEKKSR